MLGGRFASGSKTVGAGDISKEMLFDFLQDKMDGGAKKKKVQNNDAKKKKVQNNDDRAKTQKENEKSLQEPETETFQLGTINRSVLRKTVPRD